MADRKSIARKFVEEAYGKGNADSIEKVLARDYVCHDPIMGDLDVNALKNQVKAFTKAFPDAANQVLTVIAEGDLVAVHWRFTGTHKGSYIGIEPTGKRITLDGFSFLRFDNDRIAEEWDQYNLFRLLRQVGAREIPGEAGMAAHH